MAMYSQLILSLTLAVSISIRADAADFSLRLLGELSIATGTLLSGVEFGGISGLDRASDGSYWAISDDRGGERGTSRCYKLSLAYDSTGFQRVTLNQQIYMQRPDGSHFPATARTVDPESIRVAPNGNLYWSSEGIWSPNPLDRYQPFVREMRPDGSFVREFATPAQYRYVDNRTSGGRSNKLFEALAVTPGGKLFVANEDALLEDGHISSLSRGSVIRVTALDPLSSKATAQYAYQLPPIPLPAAPGSAALPDNGLSELLALSETAFIAVERAFAPGQGNVIRLVLAVIGPDTTDVSDIPSLAAARFVPMQRELILEMQLEYLGIKLDNIEGISWGDRLPNGHRTLVLVSDNNFSAKQVTHFIAFELVPKQSTVGGNASPLISQ